jgi:hypothetical protein
MLGYMILHDAAPEAADIPGIKLLRYVYEVLLVYLVLI